MVCFFHVTYNNDGFSISQINTLQVAIKKNSGKGIDDT